MPKLDSKHIKFVVLDSFEQSNVHIVTHYKWSISHVIVLSIYGQDKVAAFKEMHRILKEVEEEYRNPRRLAIVLSLPPISFELAIDGID